MARILVTEEIAEGGLDRLRAAGHEVDVQTDLSKLDTAIIGAHALIIRSATQVTAEVLELATDLMVVGRAGIGLDNVDVDAATRRGVMVVNAPQSNIISAAEHTMALLLAQARNVPQAHAALVAGRWERSRWEGVELADKVLAVVGLGRIGKLVADRAKAFGMRVIAYDPFVAADRARQMGVELVSLDQAVAEADFLTIHLPKTKETTGLINRDLLLKAKPSLRVINVARGGIVVEQDLADAVRDGVIAGAALDVFATEPTTSSPLFELDSVVVTPHLGASTREAQDKAGDTIADMVQLALAGEFVPFAVNVNAAEANETLRPFLPLAERLGRLFASLAPAPDVLEVRRRGRHRRLRHAHPHAGRAEGLLQRVERRDRHLRQRPAARPGPRRRGARGQFGVLAGLRQPRHLPRRRPPAVRHARRSAQRAAPGADRRAPRRRAAERQHADGQERRPAGRDRPRRHDRSATPA